MALVFCLYYYTQLDGIPFLIKMVGILFDIWTKEDF
jgi:hypothetical protein